MAQINASGSEKLFRIERFAGVNESPDGDIGIDTGEAAEMRNFRITKEGNLQIRPGYTELLNLDDGPVRGLWHGYIGSADIIVNSLASWTYGTNWTYSDGVASHSDGTASDLSKSLTVGEGTTYRVTFRLNRTAGTLVLGFDSTSGSFSYARGMAETKSYSFDLEATSSGTAILSFAASSTFIGSIDSIMVMAMPLSVECFVGVCNGKAYLMDLETSTATQIGTLTDAPTTMFGFEGKLYFLTGSDYMEWDGTTFQAVDPYVPIITTSTAPSGGGAELQQVNKLTGSKIQWFSSTAESTEYQLAEVDIDSVDWVKVNGVLQTVTTDYTVDLTAGEVTLNSAPGTGIDDVKIQYTKGVGDPNTILAQRFMEYYNGSTDSRVFLYGDGTNKAYYSGVEYETGRPSAAYFPDLNVLDVGEALTPITALVRHFNKLMAFKKGGGTYLIDYDFIALEDGTTTPGFFTRPIDKETGHESYGQVRLVNNYPISFEGSSVYRWGLIYSSGVQDERSAKVISDRVIGTLKGLDLTDAIAFDDEYNREYWILSGTTALIYNYSGETDYDRSYKNNVWYVYTDIPATCFIQFGGRVFFGSSDGGLMEITSDARSNNGTDIDAYWESGSMAFGAEHMRKFLTYIYATIKPDTNVRVTMTLETDRKSDYAEKLIANSVLTFEHANFGYWGFGTNRKPQVKRVKLKAKKFVYLKIIFKSISASAVATVMSVTLPVNYTGLAK